MRRQSVVIIVQNLPVPLDRRVWMECQALRDAQYEVSVICPKSPGDRSFEMLDGVALYKYRAAPATTGLLSYILEFVYCWLRTAMISVKVYRCHRFTVLQACNPPDTYWLLGRLWRLFGVIYVFDHHDLNPELFRSRFGDPTSVSGRIQLAILYWLEWMTYRTARHVITTNESYRRIALERSKLGSADVTVVRSGPDTSIMRPVPESTELRCGADHLLAYIGIMGPQDNVDVLLQVMRVLTVDLGRRDVHLVLMGFGDCLDGLKVKAVELGVAGVVTFTGRADLRMIADYLSTADIGVSPDLKTPLNDISTHNKTMEYMAFGLPIVSFDLAESRISAGAGSLYVPSGDVRAFAEAVDELLNDEERRLQMGRYSRERCVSEMDWQPQARKYVRVFDRLTGHLPRLRLQVGERHLDITPQAASTVLSREAE
ncbi:glycosyltransferase family 4 protein [Kineosporia mesophila]|uniref:Glycosyltransferase family 4 protein n=1 Tax=Kineosporia mesophila TaxID=566012 RepID=A0ABP6YZ42_9ACTN|nr:glycosyltransferase family 4 protein [Kineosporia mesophila]MCD5350977.1 glycosyltransferase family 4 protein [Kineosporia mesophila]